MKIITVNKLDGIPSQYQADIYTAMKRCSNGQRLVVCLYFMSDVSDDYHHLSDIQRELIKIFPPSLPFHYMPQDYANFQASTIRFLFNHETKAVKDGLIAENQRLWTSPKRGHWRNTDLGNQVARQILRDNHLLIQKDGIALNPIDEDFVQVERRYMEEELVSEITSEITDDLDIDNSTPNENLLTHADHILSSLPKIDFERLPPFSGAQLLVRGTPKDVLDIVRSATESFWANKVRITVTIDHSGYYVEIDATYGEENEG